MTGNNKHKRHARELQAARGGSYVRARRMVSRSHCPPITAMLGHGPDGRPVKIDLTRAYSWPLHVITGVSGTGKTVLAATICHSLVEGRKASGVSVSVSSASGRSLWPDQATVIDPPDTVEVIAHEMRRREELLRTACDRHQDVVNHVETYRQLGHILPTKVFILDPLEVQDLRAIGELLVSAAAKAQYLGLRFIVTSQRDLLYHLRCGAGADLHAAVAAFIRLRGESAPFHGLEAGCGVVRKGTSLFRPGQAEDDRLFTVKRWVFDDLPPISPPEAARG
ncbi:Septum-associated FtsK-like translocase of DNA [Mycobacteroides abscessus subsp. massiliense]|nr:Septum-associated FtsK-like translocase of DNA [Mycobacteroides abscessus subsp. abscessus]SKT82585.1 Septum-associated FtsK-like translocase of DNA [Mycobacteroides abscessus subsp. massiliense]SKT97880.1 Septum-associated FtsK-like translocase of DNA [Mycobacteroides abscessus subsp. massiliense]